MKLASVLQLVGMAGVACGFAWWFNPAIGLIVGSVELALVGYALEDNDAP